MKDSYNKLKEKQLADKGWAAMNELLDREMPVERKRRRGIVWMVQLAAALMLPILGIGTLTWFSAQDNQPEGPIATGIHSSTRPSASNPGPASQAAAPAQGNDNGAMNSEQAVSPATTPASGTPSEPAISVRASLESGTAMNTGTPEIIPSPTPALEQAIPTPYADHTGAPQQLTLKPGYLDALPQANATPAPLYPRPVVFPNTLDVPGALAANEPQPSTVQAAPWTFGAGAGVQSATDLSGLNGAVAGLSVDYKLNKHFGLRSGLNYQGFQPDNTERPIASISASTYTDATGFDNYNPGGFGIATTPDDLQVDVPVARLHRVDAPLLAYWQPWRVLRVFGGVRIGYNMYAQAAQKAQTEFGAFETPDGGNNARALNRSLNESLPNWDPSWSGGLGIGLGKRAELSLLYNHPWRVSGKQNQQTMEAFIPGPASNAGNATPGSTNAASFQVSATVFF